METILCPTDFSSVADNALKFAIEFAKKSNSALVLFHTERSSIPVAGLLTVQDLPLHTAENVKPRLEQLCAAIQDENHGLDCTYVLEKGFLAENLGEYVEEHPVSLIIMGTAGARGLNALFEGSNAAEIMEEAECPTLIIPENAVYKDPKLFVYATDLLDNEEEVVNEILKITQPFNAELELLHVKSDDALELVNSETALNQIVQQHNGDNIRYKIIEDYDSVHAIEDYAKTRADILVMASRKKSFLEKLFSKNRTQRIAYDADVPLLVMHKGK